ncbi:hypothetical protein ECE50_005360 [Chitinophaga sp. Mgbs1]|uniref:Uncharacterized protein n=1 Tax=Chitinophaga solisilvae TaxID=1233460 RepID=A0A9Q5D4S0_9BACT|nr:hypothetical protein [Chitinophaga solisilvae]
MKKTLVTIFIGIVAGIALIVLFRQSPTKAAGTTEKKPAYTFNITFDSAVPYKLSPSASEEDLVSFAWNEFFALNWKSSYSSSFKYRGYADPTWSYINDKSPYPAEPLVWETYAHRVELRPNDDNMQAFDSEPRYVYASNIPPKNDTVKQNLFNNLDENNEIGSCNLYAKILPDYNTNLQVLYQAKVNRDEFDYKYKNYRKEADLKAAVLKTANNIEMYNDYYYKAGGSTCNCPDTARVFCLPCGGARVPGTLGIYTGALEVKSAWREVTDQEVATHLTRQVLVYEKVNGKTVAVNKRYGLIGLHIVHKLANYPAFTFATFEHVDVDTKDNMGYIRLDPDNTPLGDKKPRLYSRARPIPDVVKASTDYVHIQLSRRNFNSVWKNYRLVGIQGKPSSDTSAFNYFLANYVIESDSALSNFRGSSLEAPYNGGLNLLYKKMRYNQGGCQGCHGVTQLRGSDFSFLMGLKDQPHKTPDISRSDSKLALYLQAFEEVNKSEGKQKKK